VFAAAKTVVKLLRRADRERRRFFVVKRAASLELATGFFQRDARGDDLDDVGACDHLVDKVLGNAAHCVMVAGSGARAIGPPCKVSASAQSSLDASASGAHVDLARGACLELAHDLAHVFHGRGAGGFDDLVDHRVNRIIR